MVIDALANIEIEEHVRIVALHVEDLTAGMIAVEDVVAKNGALIIPKGQTMTWPIMQGLKNFAKQVGVVEPVKVQVGLSG